MRKGKRSVAGREREEIGPKDDHVGLLEAVKVELRNGKRKREL